MNRSTVVKLAGFLAVALQPNLYAHGDANPPEASEKEALLKHWEVPEINLGFMDIPELKSAFIDVYPNNRQDGLNVGPLSSAVSCKNCEQQIVDLANDFNNGEFGNYDSLLIAQDGHLVFESYFKRGRVNLSHPQSSAAKSYTALVLARAMQLGHVTMDDLHKPIIDLLPELDTSNLAAGAESVTLHHALTMTTGIGMSSEAWQSITGERSKGVGQIQALLEETRPITKDNMTFAYGTGHEFVMQVVNAKVPGGVAAFIRDELLTPMGITDYDWRTAQSGLPESGWKVSLKSRDMLKLGLLVHNNGKWRGEQWVSAPFIEQLAKRQVATGEADIFGGGELVSNQAYGYLWWHAEVQVGGTTYPVLSAQGGGGMFIVIVKDLDLVVVTTGHENQTTVQQIVAERVLPVFIGS